MSKKKMRAIAYLGADAFAAGDETKKEKQWKYIKEYSRAHNIEVVKVFDISYLSKAMRSEQIKRITDAIYHRKADALIVTKTKIVADDIVSVYKVAGNIAAVGGKLITVDEGEVFLNINMTPARTKGDKK